MTKRLIFNREKVFHVLYYALCMVFLLFLSCGEGHYSYSESGSIAFSVEWKDALLSETESDTIKAASLDCGAAGVATVTFDVYSSSGAYLTGESWPCSNHQGTVDGVPAGSNRKLIVSGEDSVGNVLYRGEKTGITVTAGQTANVGTIQVSPYSPATTTTSPTTTTTTTSTTTTTIPSAPSAPTNVRASAGNREITISWNSVSGATSYNIYWATWPGVSSGNYEGAISAIASTSYIHTGLTNDTTYYYVVTAESDYGESDESGEVSATPDEASTPLLSEIGTISHDEEKHYYEVFVSSGQSLFVTLNIASNMQDFYLYAKYGSLPTTSDYDAKSETGEDEAINITNTQSGTYYIMVYSYYYFSYYSGDYTITASTSVTSLTSGTSTAGSISHDEEKHYYEVFVSSGQSLFVTLNIASNMQDFYLYAKYGSLPTTSDYDAKSETGEDEAINITNTQSGTYYIMVYTYYYFSYYSGDYTITASTGL